MAITAAVNEASEHHRLAGAGHKQTCAFVMFSDGQDNYNTDKEMDKAIEAAGKKLRANGMQTTFTAVGFFVFVFRFSFQVPVPPSCFTR